MTIYFQVKCLNSVNFVLLNLKCHKKSIYINIYSCVTLIYLLLFKTINALNFMCVKFLKFSTYHFCRFIYQMLKCIFILWLVTKVWNKLFWHKIYIKITFMYNIIIIYTIYLSLFNTSILYQIISIMNALSLNNII